jgi:hypothetical protein
VLIDKVSQPDPPRLALLKRLHALALCQQ